MSSLIPGLFRLLAPWPLPLLHALGWGLGWLAWLGSPRYRRRLGEHAALAGVPWRQRLRAIGEAGKLVAELPRLWLGPPVRVEWRGAEALEAAQARDRGVLFLTPHLGCFEITAQAYAERFGERRPMTVLFRPARQPALRELVARARQRPGLRTVPTTLAGVRQLMQALRQGQAVGLLPDQVPPEGLGVWAPFFGRPAYTMTLGARLAQVSGAEVVLAWGERLPWGQGFRVHVRTLASVQPLPLSRDPQQAATQINAAMEALVRERPSQYLWAYARYKAPRAAD